MEKTCEEIREILVDYADGRLSQSDSNKVAEHLGKCKNCRRILDALQRSLELSEVVWEDGLAEINKIRAPTPGKAPKIRWSRYAAVAASILLVATASVLWRALTRPAKKQTSFAQIERYVTDSASAARLLAATDLLAKCTDDEAFVKQQYRHIIEVYPNTTAAAKAKSRI